MPEFHVPDGQPVVVSFGGGVDSSAMLLGLMQCGRVPDLTLFADVGNERPETYEWIEQFDPWLQERGFPAITWVKYVPQRFKHGPYDDLFGNCWQNSTLPSLAYGRKSCSLKWKVAPMDKFVERYSPFDEWRFSGGKILRLIGYDAGPKDSCRGVNSTDTDKYEYRYPLREWGWTREHCEQVIAAYGLPVPIKSACFFCPSVQKDELVDLALKHPDLARRAVAMEDRAQPNLKAIQGLWRNGVKGTRKPENKKPGRWRTFLEEEGFGDILPDTEG